MRRPLGTLILLAALSGLLSATAVGCGSGDEPEPSPGPPPSSGSAPAVPVGADAMLLSETAAGGETSEVAVRLDGPDAAEGLTTLTADLHDRLTEKVTGAVETMEVPTGHELYGAVVAVGCDVPPGVAVDRRGAEVRLVPRKSATELEECYAPVTTVAVVPVPTG